MWVPAATPLAAGWIPGADLRDSRALPVLVVASRDDADLEAAIAAVADDLVDAEIVVSQQAPSGLQPFEPFTVALLNRGVPSFAVETDGTLHTALMRSCTGWPSGIWIDEPRRTAPDGSNFQLQHWTHVFDYALVCGAGDWRHAEIPGPQRFHSPARCWPRRRPAGLAGCPPPVRCCRSTRPARCSWVPSRPRATRWRAAAAIPSTPAGWPSGWSKPAAATPTSWCARRWARCPSCIRPICWSGRGQVSRRHLTELHGYQIGTALARLDLPRLFDGADTALAPHTENCQPLYARYWLHNRGPAPLGGLPAVAHLHPHRLTAAAGDDVVLRLTAASDSCDAPLVGTVRLVCPHGWSASPAKLPFTLRPGEHLEADVTLKMPRSGRSRLYPVRAQLQVTGERHLARLASGRRRRVHDLGRWG